MLYPGCMDPAASNYLSTANYETACTIFGCTDPNYPNYDPKATKQLYCVPNRPGCAWTRPPQILTQATP